MPDKIFLDTNILLYLLSDNLTKKQTSKKLLELKPNISIQVLNEFANVCFKKFSIDGKDIKKLIQEIGIQTNVLIYTKETIIQSIELKNKYKFQFYDCLILSTALENNCTTIYSEDMQHNQVIKKQLIIKNPFN